MRTTVTLDDDLAIQLEQARRERGLTFKQAVNDAIRRGLAAGSGKRNGTAPATGPTRPLPLGRRLVADLDNVAEVLAVAEGEGYR